MVLSLRSTALEPTRAELAGARLFERVRRLAPVYGLPILAILLIVFFSVLFPRTYPTLANLNAVIDNQAVIALLALAAFIPMMAGKIDLTVGFGIVLWHVLAISFQVNSHMSWGLAVLIVLCLGVGLGLVNAVLVELAQIDAFVATLGTGTIIYAIALWHTGGQQVVGSLPAEFIAIDGLRIRGLPISAFYVLVLAVVLWLIADYLPLGRFIYAIGANPRAASLNGIPVRRYVVLTFAASGLVTAFAGVVLASQLQIGQASVGLDFLLPALVGVFLGSTTIKLGRVNVWGTVVGVIVLAAGISGIQQLGASFFVEPLFNGVTLVASIAIASFAQRRRGSIRASRIVAMAVGQSPAGVEPLEHEEVAAPSIASEAPTDEGLERARRCIDRMAEAVDAIAGAKDLTVRERVWHTAVADETIGAQLRRLLEPLEDIVPDSLTGPATEALR